MSRDYKYFVILFSNKKKRRVLYKSTNLNNTKTKYNELLEKEKPLFPQVYRGKELVKYEIALVSKEDMLQPELFKKDEFGRQQRVEFNSGPYVFLEISDYFIEESIWDYQSNEYISFDKLYNKLTYKHVLKQAFTLNAKLFIQIENDVKMYGLKNVNDAKRLLNTLNKKAIDDGHGYIMFVEDISSAQRRSLYDLLEGKGYNRSMLYKHYSY
jgi:hypothetical protein